MKNLAKTYLVDKSSTDIYNIELTDVMFLLESPGGFFIKRAKAVKERFEGTTGQRLLFEALKTQKMVAGDSALAEELATLGELRAVKAGEMIIQQGSADNDIFFILTGSFNIVVNGQVIAKRIPNDHVGEMAAIDPTQPRSATVIASEDSVVYQLTEPHLAELGNRYGAIWRFFGKELVKRLAQRNALVIAKRSKIRVFIFSSTEALFIAREVQNHFASDNFAVVIWSDGVFKASSYAIESLEKAVDDSDFAIAIAQPDDLTGSRGITKPSPRDNVIFELGFFIGRIGRKRTLLLEPRGEEVKLPTDLSGLMTIGYPSGEPRNIASLLGPACHQIRKIINELGPRD